MAGPETSADPIPGRSVDPRPDLKLKQRMVCVLLAAVAAGLSARAGTALLGIATALTLASMVSDRRRLRLLGAAAALLWGGLIALAGHLASDSFGVRYVWLYSSADLPLAYKVANVWGGDEGTTLMLAAFCATLAAGIARRADAGGRPGAVIAGLIATWYAATALWLAPFAATPPDWLADSPSQGMNAHLVKIWMLLHAPLVLTAYAWILYLVVPALAALGGALTTWPAPARTQARRAWAVLSAGIGFGMIWAFEDPMYGQVWHWDPVQTAVFAVWCFLSAHLHGLVLWRAGRIGWRWAPVTGVLAAVTAAAAMAVTRNPVLASSHRYVGAQSWISHTALAVVLLGVLVIMLAASRRAGGRGSHRADMTRAASASDGLAQAASTQAASTRDTAPKGAAGLTPQGWGLRLAQWGFSGAGVLALVFLAQAFLSAGLAEPRPPEDKPFMAMLLNLVQGDDRAALKAAFDRWDVNGYALARTLLAPLAVFGFVGGWFFFRRVSPRMAWWSLAIAAVVAGVTWAFGGVTTQLYAGRGVLSQRIVALLPWLDAILMAGVYLALACAAWVAVSLRRQGWQSLSAVLPSATVHVGVALMLWGGLLSTALNSHTEYQVPLIEDGAWQPGTDGRAIRFARFEAGAVQDGAVGAADAVQATTSFEYRDSSGDVFQGSALYRDSRPAPERYDGPLRAACEMFDYRYSRYISTPGYILEPAIDHAWSRAVQVWVSPAAAFAEAPMSLAPLLPAPLSVAPAEPPMATVLVKIFPYSSLLWAGLILAVAGGGWLAFAPVAGRR